MVVKVGYLVNRLHDTARMELLGFILKLFYRKLKVGGLKIVLQEVLGLSFSNRNIKVPDYIS